MPKSADFKNADYIIKYSKTIIELKCLEKDQGNTKSFLDKLYNLNKTQFEYIYSKEARDREVTEVAKESVLVFKRNFARSISKAVVRRILKANKQIKETKINLELNNYSGVVWIVNENNNILNPSLLIAIVKKTLEKKQHSSIQAIILTNVNMSVSYGEKDLPSLYWIPIFRETCNKETRLFITYLGTKWNEYIIDKFEIPEDAPKSIGCGCDESLDFFNKMKNFS